MKLKEIKEINKKTKNEIEQAFKKLETKKRLFFNHRFHKYVVSYEITEDDKIKVISNIGNYRKVSNTSDNLAVINKAIVKNKIDIIRKIDDYEDTFKQRLFILLFNLLLVILTGGCVPFAFFTGSYWLLLFSIITFSVTVVTTSMSGIEYYVLAKEIQNLKDVTGYKAENEFKLPDIKLSTLKNK